jgi:hypothetical protein
MSAEGGTTNDHQELDVDTPLEFDICLTEEDIGA